MNHLVQEDNPSYAVAVLQRLVNENNSRLTVDENRAAELALLFGSGKLLEVHRNIRELRLPVHQVVSVVRYLGPIDPAIVHSGSNILESAHLATSIPERGVLSIINSPTCCTPTFFSLPATPSAEVPVFKQNRIKQASQFTRGALSALYLGCFSQCMSSCNVPPVVSRMPEAAERALVSVLAGRSLTTRGL